MPSPDADRLTRQHRRELAAVTSLVTGRVQQLARQADTADIDAWFRRMLEELVALVAAAWQRVRRLGSEYLVDHARVEGFDVTPTLAMWVTDQVLTSLRVTGPIEFKRHMTLTGDAALSRAAMAKTLPAAATRLVLAGERDTVTATIRDADAIVGWRRVTDSDPCAFCSMLASRGAVYDLATVHFDAHDGDDCTAEPLYEHEDEPREVDELYQQWLTATAGTSGAASLRAWRRFWDARNTTE